MLIQNVISSAFIKSVDIELYFSRHFEEETCLQLYLSSWFKTGGNGQVYCETDEAQIFYLL